MAKTKLRWTKKQPTKNGFYLWRGDTKYTPMRVVVEDGSVVGFIADIQPIPLTVWIGWDGKWKGPIKEPNV